MKLGSTSEPACSEEMNTQLQALEVDVDGFILLKAEIVATMLRLSKPRVYQLARKGEIPFVKIGKSVRFFPNDVKRFVLSRIRNGNSL